MRGHATIDNKYIKYGMLDNIPHREEDTIYGNGLPLEVQNRPDIVHGLLANYQVIQRCRGPCIILYYVGGQVY